MAYITNIPELVEKLKPRLFDYLEMESPTDIHPTKRFRCFAHEEKTGSMLFNPKSNGTTVTCFGGCGSFDIFSACAHIEGMPAAGDGWVHTTLPHLAEKLGIDVKLGECSAEERERLDLQRLANAITVIMESRPADPKYLESRGWSAEHLTIGSCNPEDLTNELIDQGFTIQEIARSGFIKSNSRASFFGENKITFSIKDYSGKTQGFISRNPEGLQPKYINSAENLLYRKGESLLGIDVALKTARREGLFVLEGPGDLAALHQAGVLNAAAVCGTAFTSSHLNLLKMLGINKVFFCLDWDTPGIVATHRILSEELQFAPGVSCYVINPPEGEEFIKDVSDLLGEEDGLKRFKALKKTNAFEWVLDYISENATPEAVCAQMVPIIASEPSAIRRELLVGKIAEFTGFSPNSIGQDVNSIRNHKTQERQKRVSAAVERYRKSAATDPDNALAHISKHLEDLERIDKSYKKKEVGAAYQMNRFDAIQEQKQLTNDGTMTEFQLRHHSELGAALSGGMNVTSGVLMLVGGDANAAKTAFAISILCDIALNDPNAIAVMFSTDDAYAQIEPRLVTNIAAMMQEPGDATLPIGMAASPHRQQVSQATWDVYNRAVAKLREMLIEEKLVILDAEDGSNLTSLERYLGHIRKNDTNSKLFVAMDSPYNLSDYDELDQTSRMRNIATHMKRISGKYRCCMFATAEYRKSASSTDTKKIRWPVNDDIADARAMKYRPNLIMHVYNDLHTRGEDAEIFWVQKGERKPRLAISIAKNKLTSFKDKLMLDLDVTTVALKEKSVAEAREEAGRYMSEQEEAEGNGEGVFYLDVDGV